MIPERVWRAVCQHYNARNRAPYRRVNVNNDSKPSSSMQSRGKSTVFMNHKVTARLVRSQIILEKIPTAQRLFQYLNWTMRIDKMAQTITVMEGRGGAKVLLFDVELHGPRGQRLYALCTPNDVTSPNAQPWQLAHLLTANVLTNLLGIDVESLPHGLRAVSSQFGPYRNIKSNHDVHNDVHDGNLKAIKQQIVSIDERKNMMRYFRLKCIRTGNKQEEERELIVTVSALCRCVHSALRDDNVHLIPIVSIVSRKIRECDENMEDFRFVFCLFSVCFLFNFCFHYSIPRVPNTT